MQWRIAAGLAAAATAAALRAGPKSSPGLPPLVLLACSALLAGWLLLCRCRATEASSPSGLPPAACSAAFSEARMRWPTPGEQVRTQELLERLTEKERAILNDAPEDVTHMLFLARFLRGLPTFELALERLRETVAYREKFGEVIGRARRLIPKDTLQFRLEHVLHGDSEAVRHALRFIPEGSSDGCFVELIVIRHLDLDTALKWPTEHIIEFMVSALEQYSVVLHNHSLLQHKMCRIYFVEDACGFPLSILFQPVLWLKQTRAILPIVKVYPELVWRVTIFNAPRALKAFVSMFERLGKSWFQGWFPGGISDDDFEFQMKKLDGKLKVLSAGDWPHLAACVPLRVLELWSQCVDLRQADVAPGSVVTRASWLKQGASLHWRTSSIGGSLHTLFFSSGSGLCEAEVHVIASGGGSGTFAAPCDGLVLLVLDNAGAWQPALLASLELDVVAPAAREASGGAALARHVHGAQGEPLESHAGSAAWCCWGRANA